MLELERESQYGAWLLLFGREVNHFTASVRGGQGGTREWPYAYLEIAERQGGFDGFVTAQARQLFEMTKALPTRPIAVESIE